MKLQKRVLSIVSDREKVEKESQLVRNDIEKQREALRGIKKEMKSYTVPEVYDYISQSQETETVKKRKNYFWLSFFKAGKRSLRMEKKSCDRGRRK